MVYVSECILKANNYKIHLYISNAQKAFNVRQDFWVMLKRKCFTESKGKYYNG